MSQNKTEEHNQRDENDTIEGHPRSESGSWQADVANLLVYTAQQSKKSHLVSLTRYLCWVAGDC